MCVKTIMNFPSCVIKWQRLFETMYRVVFVGEMGTRLDGSVSLNATKDLDTPRKFNSKFAPEKCWDWKVPIRLPIVFFVPFQGRIR